MEMRPTETTEVAKSSAVPKTESQPNWTGNGQPEVPRQGSPPLRSGRRRHIYRGAALVVVAGVVAGVAFWAFPKKTKAAQTVIAPTTPVAVANVTREDVYNEVTIPAEFRAYNEVELHAKISGYLTNLTVDFGDQVKAGQLLAELEIPELKDEMDRALASQRRAEADHNEAHWAFTRLRDVEKQHPNLVAQQDLDNAEGKDLSTEAAISVAKAEVEKYQTMIAYTRITAPFAGVVTHRYVDPGALIQAGTASATQSLPLVRLSDNYRLRLDFPVSVPYVKDIQLGQPVEVRVESLGGKSLTGTISRFTHDIDETTRTMVTEIEVPNPKLELVPGMYAKVVLRVGRHAQALTIPTEAISADRKAAVYVVNSQDQIEERPVKLGLETPARYEVLSGLKEGELVVVGSRSHLKPGEKVAPKLTESLAMQ
jgi:RND family efflux transporter MFP subunit